MATQNDTLEILGLRSSDAVVYARSQSSQTGEMKLRLTTRGQAVLVALVTIVLSVVVGFFTFGASGANASTEQGETEFTYVSVAAGQTLWQLATELDPGADPRDLIAEIIRLNALTSSDVEAGQRIALPERFAH